MSRPRTKTPRTTAAESRRAIVIDEWLMASLAATRFLDARNIDESKLLADDRDKILRCFGHNNIADILKRGLH